MRVEPYAIAVPDAVLDDLRDRIRRTRWPDPAPGEAWGQGVDLGYLRGLLSYWADGFDWRERERDLNRHTHCIAAVDGVRIHFVHRRGTGRVPLVLTHGWPSTFVEMLPLVDRLDERPPARAARPDRRNGTAWWASPPERYPPVAEHVYTKIEARRNPEQRPDGGS